MRVLFQNVATLHWTPYHPTKKNWRIDSHINSCKEHCKALTGWELQLSRTLIQQDQTLPPSTPQSLSTPTTIRIYLYPIVPYHTRTVPYRILSYHIVSISIRIISYHTVYLSSYTITMDSPLLTAIPVDPPDHTTTADDLLHTAVKNNYAWCERAEWDTQSEAYLCELYNKYKDNFHKRNTGSKVKADKYVISCTYTVQYSIAQCSTVAYSTLYIYTNIRSYAPSSLCVSLLLLYTGIVQLMVPGLL
jgi:hypothetical protein